MDIMRPMVIEANGDVDDSKLSTGGHLRQQNSGHSSVDEVVKAFSRRQKLIRVHTNLDRCGLRRFEVPAELFRQTDPHVVDKISSGYMCTSCTWLSTCFFVGMCAFVYGWQSLYVQVDDSLPLSELLARPFRVPGRHRWRWRLGD